MIQRLTGRVNVVDEGRRLDELAQEWLSRALGRAVSRSEVRRFIMAGAVRMEGGPLRRPGLLVVGGRRLDAALRPQAARRPERPGVVLSRTDILFEDAWLLAVNKPAGIPTHETVDPRRPHLVGLLTRLLSTRDPDRTSVRLGIHQRLDRDTSGVILFTRDRAADADLARQFAERKVAKTYHALAARPARLPARAWSTSTPLAARGGPAQEARTDFRLLECHPGGLLVEARPRTGRKHQIRIHLSEAGLPILGDEIYGRGTNAPHAPRLMLHAFRLELRHPQTGLPLLIESPWPADFRQTLDALRVHDARRSAPGRSSRS